jgi:hypothetical protein
VPQDDDQGNKQVIRIRREQCTPSSTMPDLLQTTLFSSAAQSSKNPVVNVE